MWRIKDMSYTNAFNKAVARADAASTKAEGAAQLLEEITNGPVDSYVTTLNGQVPTVATAIDDLRDQIMAGATAPILETATLTAGQSNVTFNSIQTSGMAVYIDEGAGAYRYFNFTVDGTTSIVLRDSFPAGTIVRGVAQEIGGDVQTAVGQTQANAQLSEDWAIKTSDTVDGVEYSSKYHAGHASSSASAAAASEQNAATSESDAATSASNALGSENAAALSESNAATSEQNAAQSESNAATSEQSAAQSESNALGYSNTAQAAATDAQAARDAAFVNADVYPDVSTGLAAVADGGQFHVLDGDEIVRYRRDSSSSQTEVARYPSARGFRDMVAGIHGSAGYAPYTSFDDDVKHADVDKNGLRMDLGYVFENFGNVRSKLSPYLSYYDDLPLADVDRSGRVIAGQDNMGINKKTRLSPYMSYNDQRPLEDVDKNGTRLSTFSTDTKPPETQNWEGHIYVEFNKEAREVSIAWVHEPGVLFKQTWKPNEANFVFNYRSLHEAPFTNNPASAAWSLIAEVTTDHIPPITHKATTGETTDSGISTVGGNHDGPNGELTAFMTYCDFFLNDNLPMTEDFSGFADSVLVRWSNDLYAGNTIFEERVTTRQEMSARFTARHVEVYSKVTALEPIRVVREGGTQMTTGGFRDEFHFYERKNQGSEVYSTAHSNSGTRLEAPDTWACVCKSNTRGYFAAWLDREYGVGSHMVEEDDYLSHKNASKLYNFTVRHESGGRHFAAGESYSWRGGYAYAPLSMVDGLDGAFVFRQGDKLRLAVANSATQLSGTLRLPHEFIGAEFPEIGNINGIGEHVEFTEYSAKPYKEIV